MMADQFFLLLTFPLTLSVFGLLVGSFLNVVIFRLPEIIKRQKIFQAAETLASDKEIQKFLASNELNKTSETGETSQSDVSELARCAGNLRGKIESLSDFNLSVPRSRCPQCGHFICWYENIPLVSWMALRGKCRACANPISVRYPLVELCTSACFALVALAHPGLQALWWCCASAVLIALAMIDHDTRTEPALLVSFLLWAGLFGSVFGSEFGPGFLSQNALVGAAAGYAAMRFIKIFNNTFTRFLSAPTKKYRCESNLLVALGAWFGVFGFAEILTICTFFAITFFISMRFKEKNKTDIKQVVNSPPLGLFLCFAGLTLVLKPLYF